MYLCKPVFRKKRDMIVGSHLVKEIPSLVPTHLESADASSAAVFLWQLQYSCIWQNHVGTPLKTSFFKALGAWDPWVNSMQPLHRAESSENHQNTASWSTSYLSRWPAALTVRDRFCRCTWAILLKHTKLVSYGRWKTAGSESVSQWYVFIWLYYLFRQNKWKMLQEWFYGGLQQSSAFFLSWSLKCWILLRKLNSLT